LVSNLNFRTRVQHFRLNINDVKFNLMNDKLVRKVPYLLVLASLVVSFSSIFVELPVGQTTPQIVAYKVQGTTNLGDPGSESFWQNIPWVNVSLTANLQGVPTSGITPYLLVKAAWNGTDMLVLEQWPAPNPAVNTWSAAPAAFVPASLLSKTTLNGVTDLQELVPGVTYSIEKNYTGYISYVNNTEYQGRIVLSYSGLTLPLPNGTSITVLPDGRILVPDNRGFQWLFTNYGLFYGYYVNSTYYYPDRTAIMWYMGTETNPSNCMNIGGDYANENFDGFTITKVGGSLSSGPANIWMWVSGATWNSTSDPAFQINMWQNESITGLNYTDYKDHGFAVPLYTNQSGLYEVDTAGFWYPPVQSSGLNGSLFYIWTGAKWENGYWVVEFVRPMQVPQALANYEPQFQVGKEYDVAFAVWQGKAGETLFDKSITSGFLTLYVSPQSPGTVTPTPATNTTNTSTATPTSASAPNVTLDVTIAGVIIAVIALLVLYLVYRR
jgi:cytochrome b558/566 subunit A